MEYNLTEILFVSSLLLLISILISKPSTNYGIPSLLVFLGIGMLFGNGGKYDFYFNAPKFSEALGGVALSFILFSGGLETRWTYIKNILPEGISLATIGVFLSVFIAGSLIHITTHFTFIESLLIGSIISSTDSAAVFSIMKTGKFRLKENITKTLELESGCNDPMAYFLTISFSKMIMNGSNNFLILFPTFLIQMSMGFIIGILFGKLSLYILKNINLANKGLYPVLMISLVTLAFSSANFVQGSGFLAVYIMGIIIGNGDFSEKYDIIHFFQGVSWFMQITMFLVLGLQVFPNQMLPFLGKGLLIAGISLFIARPLSVFSVYALSKASWRKKTFISWVGLKGATPIVFAIYPAILGLKNADDIFNIVFFVVLASVLIQGSTINLLANKLKLIITESNETLKE
ncbi:potassium/proton antiporter [Aureibacter tunicatorum]|uniref:Cell volume regulation protein A n=1 Tax=Aureibacter tunicatorum TaxID=866807 RepID=A0AAE4BSG8_9BACT|nr:potassium/proton antiporter [Aureibacter tunicatorum]MDR6239741.1 cell volume regulation protein A [Aureibacter tunicatorum]BDD04217.1 potassium/proton antiporter [Aureibacter tunicatorum]